MTLTSAARWGAMKVGYLTDTALDGLVKVTTWALKPFTPVRGGCLLHWHPEEWKRLGLPRFDAWREPGAYTVRLLGYELIIDLAT